MTNHTCKFTRLLWYDNLFIGLRQRVVVYQIFLYLNSSLPLFCPYLPISLDVIFKKIFQIYRQTMESIYHWFKLSLYVCRVKKSSWLPFTIIVVMHDIWAMWYLLFLFIILPLLNVPPPLSQNYIQSAVTKFFLSVSD